MSSIGMSPGAHIHPFLPPHAALTRCYTVKLQSIPVPKKPGTIGSAVNYPLICHCEHVRCIMVSLIRLEVSVSLRLLYTLQHVAFSVRLVVACFLHTCTGSFYRNSSHRKLVSIIQEDMITTRVTWLCFLMFLAVWLTCDKYFPAHYHCLAKLSHFIACPLWASCVFQQSLMLS